MTNATQPTTTTAATAGHALGFQTLDDEREIDSLSVDGALPPWLAGSLVRTGPAKFEAGARTLNHWFDGLAMLHRFSFADGEVSYANRFLRSRAYGEVDAHSRLGYMEFATDPCRSLFKRISTLFKPAFSDNGNVNVARIGDELVAMTETPLPVVFDPHTLEAAGVAYEPPGQLTTAHPHHDRERNELVNFAAQLGPRSQYRFYSQRSRSEQHRIAKLPVREPAYVHSFGMTERHLVLAEFPFRVNPMRLATSGRPYIENYRWKPELGTRLHVIDRASGDLRRTFEADACFAFHHVNAYEQGDELVVDLCAYEDAEIIGALYLDSLRDGSSPIPAPELRRYRLGLDSGRLQQERLAENLELPRIDYRVCNGRPHRYVYGAASGATASRFLDHIVKVDVDRGGSLTWSEEGCHPGEPVFVPVPGDRAEDAGVLLSVTLDLRSASSFLLVLDASDLSELARAQVPHHIPMSFHGNFFGDVS